MQFKGTVPTTAALRALDISLQTEGTVFFVADPAGDDSETAAPYICRIGLAVAELGNIVVPGGGTTGSISWLKMSNLIHKATVRPTTPPPFSGIEWFASLTIPTRIIIWKSFDGDWIPYGNSPIFYITNPLNEVTPDYGYQLLWRTDIDVLMIANSATPTSADWVAT